MGRVPGAHRLPAGSRTRRVRAPAHPRRAAPRGPTPGGSRPPPTARRPRLAWRLLKYWTAPMSWCLPPPVGKAEYRSRNDHQTGRSDTPAL